MLVANGKLLLLFISYYNHNKKMINAKKVCI